MYLPCITVDGVAGIPWACRPWLSFRFRWAKHRWLLAVRNISDYP